MNDDTRRSRTAVATLATQVGTFALIGIASTAAYIVLYAGLRGVLPAIAANAVALFVTAIGNTAANRRLTFGVRDRRSMVRDQAAGMGAFAIALVITSGAVAVLALVAPRASRPLEIAVLVGANVVATAVRFLVLRAAIAPAATTDRRPATEHVERTSV